MLEKEKKIAWDICQWGNNHKLFEFLPRVHFQ